MRKEFLAIGMCLTLLVFSGAYWYIDALWKTQRISELENAILGLRQNEKPVAEAGPDQIAKAGNAVYLNGTGTDPDGTIELFEWDFDNDGIFDWNSTVNGVVSHIYHIAGTYLAVLRVTDNHGAIDEDVSLIKVYEEYNVFIYVPVYNRSSRAQNMVLKITTEDGTPIVGVNATYKQIAQDFMFGGCCGGWENATLAKELGINLMGGPNNLAADWAARLYSMPPPYNFTEDVTEWLDHIDYMKRTFGVRYVVRGIGIPSICWNIGGFCEAGSPPAWANITDIEGFLKPSWLEYAKTWVLRLNPDLYLIQGAPIAWVDEPPERIEKNWDLLKWQIEVIKSIDPDARCAVAISAGWNGTGSPLDHDVFAFLDAMFAAGVSVEVIAIEYHPGIDNCSPDISHMAAFYKALGKYNRDIFIWDACTVSNGSLGYPDPGYYSEEWQAEAMSGALKVAFENPLVIGIAFMVFQDYIGSGPNNTNAYWGFIRLDGTPKPSFYQTRDYWRSTFVSGQAVTDENGEIWFTGYPGTYEVTIDGKVYQEEFARPRIVP
jgi:hypothetical protein